MLRLLYYLYKKSVKISTKKGCGLIIRHGRIIRILRYIRPSQSGGGGGGGGMFTR